MEFWRRGIVSLSQEGIKEGKVKQEGREAGLFFYGAWLTTEVAGVLGTSTVRSSTKKWRMLKHTRK